MTTLEDRIKSELRTERELVPKATPAALPQAHSRWRPRYLAAVAVLALMVGLGLGVDRITSAEDRTVAAALEGGEFIIDGDVVVPVMADLGRPGGAPVRILAGAPAPSLKVALELSGAEQVLVQDTPRWDQATNPGNVTAVFVGSVNGRSVFLHTNPIGLIERVQAQIEGATFGDHICMTIGDSNSSIGGSGFCSGAATSVGGRYHDNSAGVSFGSWVTWIDVPEGTAVVTLTVDGREVAWQTPVADTVFFDIGEPPSQPVTLVAMGVDGSQTGGTSVPVAQFR